MRFQAEDRPAAKRQYTVRVWRMPEGGDFVQMQSEWCSWRWAGS